ncbi:hypothetical protein SAMN02745181_2879 [Rubritalea squalenifaciens DSM 18772]|uniref:Uncharacterized protein n=2 Tax=Rubritalea TaxID=361050 RepID=A0A1M6NJZ9_9BACT|nr:hypothetical protein [Rubritalea squalenifaciens]SHJ95986.1 hypothetical protein SAMN02745181_2879 [Rubritalea squalenifaciens DSM 18772]
MKTLAPFVIVVSFCSPFAFGQDEQAIDMEARRKSIPALEKRIDERSERLKVLAADIIRLDKRVESQIDQIVNKLASIKDSQSSGRKVSQLKMQAMEGLGKSAQRLQSRRSEVLRELKKTGSEGLKEEIDTLDKLTETRVEQIVKISNSFTQDEDVKKYESDGGYEYYSGGSFWYVENERISEEWKQNRRDKSMDKKQRDAMEGALKKSITRYESLIAGMKDKLENRDLSPEDKELIQSELQRHEETLLARKSQLTQVMTAGKPDNTSAVGKEAANDLEEAFNEAVSDLRDDLNTIRRKYQEFRTERSKLSDLQENLEARKKWLEEHDKTNP